MKSKSWWHIRQNRKSRHGALIVDEDSPLSKGNYSYLDITTSPAKNEGYIPLDKPINKKGNKSYVRKYVAKDKKKVFSKWLMKYQIDDSDMKKIEDYLKNRKK